MDFNPNLKSKAIKINYNETNNKMPKVPNFFRGDIPYYILLSKKIFKKKF